METTIIRFESVREHDRAGFENQVVEMMLKAFDLETPAKLPLLQEAEKCSGYKRLTIAGFAETFPGCPVHLQIDEVQCGEIDEVDDLETDEAHDADHLFPLPAMFSIYTFTGMPIFERLIDTLMDVRNRKAALVFRWPVGEVFAIHTWAPDKHVPGGRMVWKFPHGDTVVMEPFNQWLASMARRRAKGDYWGCEDAKILSRWRRSELDASKQERKPSRAQKPKDKKRPSSDRCQNGSVSSGDHMSKALVNCASVSPRSSTPNRTA